MWLSTDGLGVLSVSPAVATPSAPPRSGASYLE